MNDLGHIIVLCIHICEMWKCIRLFIQFTHIVVLANSSNCSYSCMRKRIPLHLGKTWLFLSSRRNIIYWKLTSKCNKCWTHLYHSQLKSKLRQYAGQEKYRRFDLEYFTMQFQKISNSRLFFISLGKIIFVGKSWWAHCNNYIRPLLSCRKVKMKKKQSFTLPSAQNTYVKHQA